MKKTQTAFRIEDEIIEKLKEIAKEKDRSVSSLVRIILKNYIKQQEI